MALHVPTAATPDETWAALSPLLSAPGRRTMRLYNTETQSFSDSAPLTRKLPDRPAATYIYSTRTATTRFVFLDFDAKHHGPEAVKRDVQMASQWLTDAGGRLIVDRSSNGGMHIICPLAPGTSATFAEMKHLVQILSHHLPTLDITPNLNPDTGCLSLPGTLDKQGRHRQLLGTLTAALDAITGGSDPAFLPNLYVNLGILKATHPAPQPAPSPETTADSPALSEFINGHGNNLRLAPEYCVSIPIPAAVLHYAIHGDTTGAAGRSWPTHSEARMSVIYHAMMRGYSINDLLALTRPGGAWHGGLGAAFHRYGPRAEQALSRDFTKALHRHHEIGLLDRHRQHKKKNSQGGNPPAPTAARAGGPLGPVDLRQWLAYAFRWADTEYRGRRQRWTVKVVLQALAYLAMKSGEQVNGAWVVAVGGRSLSLAAGLMTADAVWKVLREIRGREGAPLILTRRAVGREADAYALTRQGIEPSDISAAERIRIEPVHDAWQILGWRLQRIHDLVVYYGLTDRADIYAAAKVSRSTGDAMITDLRIAGLINITGRGRVGPGPTTLDAIASQHRLEETRQERIQHYRIERRLWHTWLSGERGDDSWRLHGQTADEAYFTGLNRDRVLALHNAYVSSVLATGPPQATDDDAAVAAADQDWTTTHRRALTLLWEQRDLHRALKLQQSYLETLEATDPPAVKGLDAPPDAHTTRHGVDEHLEGQAIGLLQDVFGSVVVLHQQRDERPDRRPSHAPGARTTTPVLH